VQRQWQALRPIWIDAAKARDAPSSASTDILREANTCVEMIDAFDTSIEAQLARWTSILNVVQIALLVLAIGSAWALLYIGHLLVLEPVSRLTGGLARIEEGDFSMRVQVASHDEFGQLSAGFNRMARNLQQFYAELEQSQREDCKPRNRARAACGALRNQRVRG
jgi:two-component system nitrate/nitrite sensor histidine kinase NarX